MTDGRLTTIERAIQLAKSGEFARIGEIRPALRRESFQGVGGHLSGLGVRRQVAALIHLARQPALVETEG